MIRRINDNATHYSGPPSKAEVQINKMSDEALRASKKLPRLDFQSVAAARPPLKKKKLSEGL